MTKRTEDFKNFLADHVNLNQTRINRLTNNVEAVTDYLRKHLDSYLRWEKQGSYGLRTIIRPINGREYDADILLFLESESSKSPKDYIRDVYKCLRDSGTYESKVRRKTRCVVVDYTGEVHLDIVPCIVSGDDQSVCNRVTNEFEITDGTGYREWFNGKNRITNGNLKLVTRMLKYLRDHKQTFTAPSILFTTLIGNAVYDWEGDLAFKTVPDTLVTICERMDQYLQAHSEMPAVNNPVLPEEDFTRHWDQAKYSHFRKMIEAYTKLIREAFDEPDAEKSVALWRQLFGDEFGKTPSNSGTALVTASIPVTPSKPYAR